jgi:hypothetical protein
MRIGHRLFTEAQVLTQLSGPLRVTEPDDTPQERAVCEAVLAQADPSLPRGRRTRAVLASDDLGRTWQVAATPHGREDPGYRGSIFEGGGIHSGGPGAGWSSLDPLTLTWGPPTDFGRTFLQRADRQSALLPNTARKLDLEGGREIAPGRTVGLYTGGSPRRPKQRIMWFTDGRLTRSVPVRFKARTRAITVVGPQELVRDGYCRVPRTAISRGFSQLMPGDAGRVLFAISGTLAPTRCRRLPPGFDLGADAYLELKPIFLRSTNGGRTWRRIRAPRGASAFFAVDGKTPIYIVSSRRCRYYESMIYRGLKKIGCRATGVPNYQQTLIDE